MLKRIGAVLLGLLAASVVMMICEFINSFLFPFPEGMNTGDVDAVRAFTATLPWTAYLLVLLGWFLGSLCGGFVVSRGVRTKTRAPVLALITFLVIAGILNNAMIGAPIMMSILGTCLFFAGSLLGRAWYIRVQSQ